MTSLISTVTGIFYLLIILSILVVVHEYGHFLFARLFGARVDEFSLFFGKVLWRLGKRGDTVYNVRAVPLGGFVKIAGMEGDDISGGRPILDAVRDPQFLGGNGLDDLVKTLNEGAEANISTVGISPEVRELIKSSIGSDGLLDGERRADLEAKQISSAISEDDKKLIQMILVADTKARDSSLYNSKPIYQRSLIIFGGPLFSLLFGYILFCAIFMLAGAPRASNKIFHVDPKTPAAKAGLKKGDRIVSIDGTAVRSGDRMIDIIHSSAGKRLSLGVKRGEATISLSVTPELKAGTDETGAKKMIGRIGILPDQDIVKLGPVAAIVEGSQFTKNYMTNLLRSLFSRKVAENVGGPVMMARVSIKFQESGFVAMVSLAAMFSISLGIMNLLPIPILDGGHLLLLSIEKIRRRRLTPREINRAQMVGVAMLAAIVCLVMYNDIARLITGKMF